MLRDAWTLGARTGTAALRPVTGGLGAARRLERRLRRDGMDRAGDAALAVLDAVLASPRADEAVDRILASPLAEHAVARALSGELVDVFARDAVRYAVLERLATELLAADALDRALDRAAELGVPQHIADRLLEDGLAEQLVQRFLDGPELERMVARVLESRLIEETIARLVDDTAARLPERQALWVLVDEVAHSPAVTDAITQQGLGMADEVAGDIRNRSRAADAWLERAARRVLRRQERGGGSPPATPEAQLP